jgi:hypothetical protein
VIVGATGMVLGCFSQTSRESNLETSACVAQRRPSDALDISPGNRGEILLILEGSRGRSVARKEPGRVWDCTTKQTGAMFWFQSRWESLAGPNSVPYLESVLALLQFLPVM